MPKRKVGDREVLEGILAATRARVERVRWQVAELRRAAAEAPRPPRWTAAFEGDGVAVIAEVKRCSPSAGTLAAELDAAARARAYEAGGAAAVSVLTEPDHFGGSLEDLAAAGRAVRVPVLRKDFVLDPVQLYEARSAGASAVLLIVRLLDPAVLADLRGLARELGLGVLVEVHAPQELDRALALEPEAVGVNSRDLETLAVDPGVWRSLLPGVPEGVTAVAESGVASRDDVERVAGWGADAVLVGTVLSGSPNPTAAVAALRGVGRVGRGTLRA